MKIEAFLRSIFLSIRSLKDNKGFMRYFNNTSWLLIEKIFKGVCVLLIGIWIARYLGPKDFGILSYSISVVFLFSCLSNLGLDNIVVRELVKNEEKHSVFLGTAFWLKVFGAILSITLIFLFSLLFPHDNNENILILVIALAHIFYSFKVIDFFFQSKVLSRYSVYASLFSNVISIAVKIILILNQAPVLAFAYIFVFDSLTLALGYYFWHSRNNYSIKEWYFDKVIAVFLLKNSWPLILSALFISIYLKIDQVMIKVMIDSESVGQYAAAVTLSEGWYFLPMIINMSIFPAIITSRKDPIIYQSRIQNLYKLMFFLAIIIAIPMTFYSEWIINLFFGDEYILAADVLRIHIWSGIFVFLGVSSTRWLLAENLQIYSMLNTAIGALINICLNYFLIKEYGIVGAAWSTLISYMFAGYICFLFFKKTRVNFISLSKSFLFLR